MTEKQIMTDVLIVGAGTAGLTAAVYAARAGKSVKLVEQYLQGGQIINASHVENFPGFESIAGFEFAEALYNQAIKIYSKRCTQQFGKSKPAGYKATGIKNSSIQPATYCQLHEAEKRLRQSLKGSLLIKSPKGNTI